MRTLRRLIASFLLVLLLPSCAGTGRWTAQPVAPQESKRTMYGGDVRVTVTDGTVYRCRGVWISQDSLGGWLREPAGEEFAVALADVVGLDTWSRQPAGVSGRGAAPNKTDFKVLIIAVVVALGLLVLRATVE